MLDKRGNLFAIIAECVTQIEWPHRFCMERIFALCSRAYLTMKNSTNLD